MYYEKINQLIETHIFKREVTTWNTHFKKTKRQEDVSIVLVDGGFIYLPRYTEKLETAWYLVEELDKNKIKTEISTDLIVKMYRWEEDKTPPYSYKRYLAKLKGKSLEDMPLLICLTALEAVGIKVETNV